MAKKKEAVAIAEQIALLLTLLRGEEDRLLYLECGCGDIRLLTDFCPRCGKCAIGCCMDVEGDTR